MSLYQCWPWAHRHFGLARGIIAGEEVPRLPLYPAHVQQFQAPKHREESTWETKLYDAEVAQPATQLLRVPHGFCHSGEVVLTEKGYLIKDLLRWHGNPTDHKVLHKLKRFPRIRRFQGTLVHLAMPSHNNYSHWLYDALPVLLACQTLKIHFDAIYFTESYPFQKQYLKALGFEGVTMLNGAEHYMVQAGEVITMNHKSKTPPNDWVRDQIVQCIVPRARETLAGRGEYPAKIYVSREGLSGRVLINEDEIFKLLQPRGFVKILPHQLSLSDQIGYFTAAKVIVGPHASSFTNMIYSAPGTKLVELMSIQHVDKTFQRMAGLFGLDYHVLLSEGEPVLTHDYWSANRADMVVSRSKLQELLVSYEII